ncbi:MoxR family ATPase [Clostridium sp. YIM B02551]|uniref:AAA family ATPase n=1 Tax=Clostridium sp. YIM B02551 TaxID=2910679 RepID=UPI001EEAC64D|nr:MoxR family ATPase [Clostridium sp. YIM B02551]
MEVVKFKEFRDKVYQNVSKVIIGKEDIIDKVLCAFICNGHVLMEDVPGLGKTKLSKSLAKTLDCTFKRIQFTPDLLPSDLTGIYFFNQKLGDFEFRKGPLLSEFVLADEINRATPRTQAALLECMEEKQLTVEGNTIKLEPPFFVMATQNPVEQFGTFPLPEAQLDRFFMRLSMGYPEFSEEESMMDRFMFNDPLDELSAVVTKSEIKYVQEHYKEVHISKEIKDYILTIVRETRNNNNVSLGCSPRASLNLMKGCQAYASINLRDYVIPEDVKKLAIPILSHRLVLKNQIGSQSEKSEEVIKEILKSVDAPLEKI